MSAAEPALFLTMFGAPFSKSHVTTAARAYKLLAGVEKKGACHIFRHTAATQMLENGADTRYVQALLGHEALQSTQIYTKVAIRKLKEVHTATHPSAKLGKRASAAATAGTDDDEDQTETPAKPGGPMSPGQATQPSPDQKHHHRAPSPQESRIVHAPGPDMKRRQFLQGLVAAGLLGRRRAASGATSRVADARIDVLLQQPIGRIAPEIYGQFVEHLGAVVYGGVWVGEQSKVPNVGGIRKSLVEALRRLKPAVIRWPGGCFADSYNWRDGVGPRARRPRHTSFWGGAAGPSKYETNAFGTNEFMRFCRLVGAQPYLAVNVRSGTPRDFMDWVEYCNGPAGTTTPADLRVANGERAPFDVHTWGIGNESWGCGGNFTPEEYASELRRFIEWVPDGGKLAFVAAGPSDDDLDWTRRLFAKLAERHAVPRVWGYSLHHYAWNVSGGRTTDWEKGKGDAVVFPDEEWYELLREADRLEGMIGDHWLAMAKFDPEHHVKLVVDEWGAWYRAGSQLDDTHLLEQQSTMRDALLAGLTLDTLNRHADKVAMANVAQLVNCLQAPFLARGDKLLLTPTFHVFEMYAPHQGAESVRTVFAAPGPQYTRNGKPATMRGLMGSASRRDKQLVLTVTNPDLHETRAAEIVLGGGATAAGLVRCTTLADHDVHAVNTFDHPDRVHPKDTTFTASGVSFVYEFPPASVTRLGIALS